MSSTTTRVSLYKPAGGENVNVTTDLNNNLDKLDTNLNFRVVANAAARNAITPFWAGLNVRETDTGNLYVSNGNAPISGSWDQIPTASTYTSAVNISAAATGTIVFNLRVGAEANNRIHVRGDGTIFWGAGGGTAVDTNLYRSAANNLKTDDTFEAVGGLVTAGDVTTAGHIVFSGTGSEMWSDGSSSTTVANTTTETVISTLTIPANDMVAGATYRLTAWGTAGVTATPTMTFRARISGVAGTQIASSGAITASSGVTGKVWKAEIMLVCLTTGGSGTAFGNLHVIEGLSVAGGNPVTTPGQRMDGGSSVTVDTTASRDLVLTAQWSAASSSNTITCRGFTAERIG